MRFEKNFVFKDIRKSLLLSIGLLATSCFCYADPGKGYLLISADDINNVTRFEQILRRGTEITTIESIAPTVEDDILKFYLDNKHNKPVLVDSNIHEKYGTYVETAIIDWLNNLDSESFEKYKDWETAIKDISQSKYQYSLVAKVSWAYLPLLTSPFYFWGTIGVAIIIGIILGAYLPGIFRKFKFKLLRGHERESGDTTIAKDEPPEGENKHQQKDFALIAKDLSTTYKDLTTKFINAEKQKDTFLKEIKQFIEHKTQSGDKDDKIEKLTTDLEKEVTLKNENEKKFNEANATLTQKEEEIKKLQPLKEKNEELEGKIAVKSDEITKLTEENSTLKAANDHFNSIKIITNDIYNLVYPTTGNQTYDSVVDVNIFYRGYMLLRELKDKIDNPNARMDNYEHWAKNQEPRTNKVNANDIKNNMGLFKTILTLYNAGITTPIPGDRKFLQLKGYCFTNADINEIIKANS